MDLSAFARNGFKDFQDISPDLQVKFQKKRLQALQLTFHTMGGAPGWSRDPDGLARRSQEVRRIQDRLDKFAQTLRQLDALLFSLAEIVASAPIRGAFWNAGIPMMVASRDLSWMRRVASALTLGMVKPDPAIETRPDRAFGFGFALRLGSKAEVSADGRSIVVDPFATVERPTGPFPLMPFGCAIGPDVCVGIQLGGDQRAVARGTTLSFVGLPVRIVYTSDGGLQINLSVLTPVVPNPLAAATGIPVLATVDAGFTAKFLQLRLPFRVPMGLFIKGKAKSACESSLLPFDDVQ
jgi:hypothetical protein